MPIFKLVIQKSRRTTSAIKSELISPTTLDTTIQPSWIPLSSLPGYSYPDPLDTAIQGHWIGVSNDLGDFFTGLAGRLRFLHHRPYPVYHQLLHLLSMF